MKKVILKKGNLFYPLENKIDLSLIDSSQYDFEITLDGKKSYYRIRYAASYYDAKPIKPSSFFLPKFSPSGVAATEIDGFCKTDLYRSTEIYRTIIGVLRKAQVFPSYYTALQRISSKRNLNNAKKVYSFSVPAIGTRKKSGVLSYDIEVELVRNRYYIVFIKENVERGYLQREEPQYVIYDKKEFDQEREILNNAVLDFAIKMAQPLNLLEYVYIMTGGDEALTARFFLDLKRVKTFDGLRYSELFKKVFPTIEVEDEIKQEMNRYLSGEQDDIYYSFQKKR